MKLFFSKYALSTGIIEADGVIHEGSCAGMATTKENGHTSHYHGEGREWHRTRDEAMKRAEIMRKQKIESLKRSIRKLEALKFKLP